MDFDFIERVVQLVEASDIGELEVESGEGLRVVVKKTSSAAPPMVAPQYYAAAPAQGAAAPAPSAPEDIIDDTIEIIKAPMVGTFYRSPAPDAPPFLEEGNVVQKSHVVCILEAMKVMNEIKAGVAGTVVSILVENGQPVEFGQPLFKIKKS
ncbi:MAG: acetyl-CoA carboxylase biotin carboxyl carrier protein [Candidatus Hinthialibacter antarcticus]|nr:acetyl-CoA carboxylase biotin carboxyl carrier protein [Candidatus Hinthialibacter antarcticus]